MRPVRLSATAAPVLLAWPALILANHAVVYPETNIYEAEATWPCGDNSILTNTSAPVTNFTFAGNAKNGVYVHFWDNFTIMSIVAGWPTGTNEYDFRSITFPTLDANATDRSNNFTVCFDYWDYNQILTYGDHLMMQFISNSGNGPRYSCAKVAYQEPHQSHFGGFCNGGIGISPTPLPLPNDTTFDYFSITGLTPTSISVSSSAFASASASASGGSSSSAVTPAHTSGLATGAKIGLGVAIPLIVIIAGILLFLYLRRRRGTSNQQKSTTIIDTDSKQHAVLEKPELQGSAHDPLLAGPVKPKSELPSTLAHDERVQPFIEQNGLVGKSGANAPWTHAKQGYIPPEFAHHPAAAEIGIGAIPGYQGGAGAGAESTTLDGSVIGDETNTSAAGYSSTMQSSSGGTGTPLLSSANSRSISREEAAALAEEADLLVQELGLVQARKRALTGFASAQGVRPEELQGTRGEDYRDLIRREAKVRARIDEIDSGGI